jgi:alkyldihydroxyacetonephosphate synthase
VLVPYGGGTNVTWSLTLPLEEKRMIVSVDVSRMTAIKWVDKENNLACV